MADPYKQTASGLYYRPDLRADSEADIAARPDAWQVLGAFGAMPTTSGMRVSPHRAQALSAWYAAIRNIAEDIGKLPLLVYRRRPDGRGKDRQPDDSRFALLHDTPNDDMTAIDFRQTLSAWALGWGNGYAEIVRNRSEDPVALVPIHPSRVPPHKITRDDMGQLVYRVQPDWTRELRETFDPIDIPAADMLHIKNIGDNGIWGNSVAQIAAESIGVNLAAQTFAAAFFGNGMNMGAVFEHPMQLSDTALTHLKESMQAQYGGASNAYKTMILEEGMKFSRSAVPPNEAQFIESRQFGIEEIARWFRISPHKLAHLLRSTFNNIEQLSLEHVTDTLMPWLVRWEQELKRKLFPDEPDMFAEHLVTGLLRGDMKTRGEFYQMQFMAGALHPNEIREFEGRNPDDLPASDKPYIQSAMVPLEQAGRPQTVPTNEFPANGQRNGAHATYE